MIQATRLEIEDRLDTIAVARASYHPNVRFQG